MLPFWIPGNLHKFTKDNLPTVIKNTKPEMKTDFFSQKLVAVFDRCRLSMNDSVFIFEATIKALRCNVDEFMLSKSFVQRIREEKKKERPLAMKVDLQNGQQV